jgi:ferredoxin-NADP reductase
VGGGSGIVPLMSMVRWARASGRAELLRVVVSVRTPADLYYADELVGPEVTVVHTRRTPDDDRRPPGHLTAAEMGPVGRDATVYLCGSGGFVEHASGLLLGLGVEPARIRVERFGPS